MPAPARCLTTCCVPVVQPAVQAEVVELAGNAAHDMGRQRITPRHIALAVSALAQRNATGPLPFSLCSHSTCPPRITPW